jgi:fructose/tagatose bisphosphate aldolase
MKERLNISTVRFKKKHRCAYCFEEGFEFIIIETSNKEICSFFGRDITPHSHRNIRLCQKCFEKLHDLLNEVENEGWEILSEEED